MTGIVFALAATFVAALPATGVAATPTIDWTQVSTQGPSARESAYMSYDSSRGKIVLFGGYEPAGSGKVDSDTWEFDGTSWTQIPVSGPPPGALGQMVFDSARGVSVLFGGGNNSTFLAPITWEWDGATWVTRFTAHRPPGRVWFGMTYDSARHLVVHDLMTGRQDEIGRVIRALRADPEVFGEPVVGNAAEPGVRLSNMHQLLKTVAGLMRQTTMAQPGVCSRCRRRARNAGRKRSWAKDSR